MFEHRVKATTNVGLQPRDIKFRGSGFRGVVSGFRA